MECISELVLNNSLFLATNSNNEKRYCDFNGSIFSSLNILRHESVGPRFALHFITLTCHINVIYKTSVILLYFRSQRNIMPLSFEVLTLVWLRMPFFLNVTLCHWIMFWKDRILNIFLFFHNSVIKLLAVTLFVCQSISITFLSVTCLIAWN
jgi:hypothetical protein